MSGRADGSRGSVRAAVAAPVVNVDSDSDSQRATAVPVRLRKARGRRSDSEGDDVSSPTFLGRSQNTYRLGSVHVGQF